MPRGLGIAKGFDKSRRNGWFISITQDDGRRPKNYFTSKLLRDRAFTKKLGEVRAIGIDAAAVLTTSDRHAMMEMRRLSAGTGYTPLEIFQRGRAQLSVGISIRGTTVGAAVSAFLKEQTVRLTDKKISDVRLKEIKNTIGRFAATMGKMPLTQCSRTSVKVYLSSLSVGPQTRMNHARNLRFFFRWCVDEDLMLKDPVPEQEGVNRIPTFFSNDQTAELFTCAREYFPALLPMLGVQWFAGLRPGASHHLQWEEIDFESRKILINPRGNKLRQPDIIEDLPLTVFGFLTPLRQASGPIAPAGHVDQNKALHHRLGYGLANDMKRWPEDVARHTFGSNLYSYYRKDSKRVEVVMLHATSEMLKKHYLFKNVPYERAQDYFASHLPSA